MAIIRGTLGKALAAGVAPELADLGRAVMREAYQHDWDKRLKMLCGWNDHGRCIIQQALHSPAVVATTLAADAGHGRLPGRTRPANRRMEILAMNTA